MSAWIRMRMLLPAIILGMSLSPALAQDNAAGKKPQIGVVSAYWAMTGQTDRVTLLVSDNAVPTPFTIDSNLPMSGICHDCNMMLHFPAREAGKVCPTCPCTVSNAECIAWTSLKPNNWQSLLQKLPRGTGLRIAFQTQGNPDSGLKSLDIDRRVVLLPIAGLADATQEQLLALVRPFGGTKVERLAQNTQLLIRLSSDWTVEKEAKFEKAVTAVGGTVAWTTTKAVATAK